ncbi:hypothetical protein M758_6G158800 [Ceratodon purpureus]|uniref:Dirigent protein n=1 Tax=Ceratodon purpureus TaxID=3225 RepID=A0A8T0HHZ3_CERPU|nr:hypothetical protein KC19_6G164700 [Ceratodon purpureus]KAG0570475.1 hypothetical protein KC19_6G165300 [Ceratodon purpureus]KAG0614197.1 hypothetical protein M758_6G158100 [Ceratodon purpureus]KAG0614205.1 hypothetical protein M758_6G158800 [Ceratodon purpureus]
MAKLAGATWHCVVMLGLILCLGACNGVSARLNPRHKTHNVTFYVQEAINTGDDATAFIVGGPDGNTSALQLGAVIVVDNAIFATADPKSKQLGKFQGLYVVDGGHKYRAEITVTIDQPGDLIECTYEILGQRPSFNTTSDRQLAVVGGTGLFLGQKGYAIAHTVSQTLLHEGTLPDAQYNVQKWTLVVGK